MIEINNYLTEKLDLDTMSDNEIEKLHKLYMVIHKEDYRITNNIKESFECLIENVHDLDSDIVTGKMLDAEVEKLHKLYMVTMKEMYPIIFKEVTRFYKDNEVNRTASPYKFERRFKRLITKLQKMVNSNIRDNRFYLMCNLAYRMYVINKKKGYV